MTDSDESLARRARCSARRKTGFFIHAAVFLAVNLLLIAVQRETTPGLHWAIFPAAGWGLGLAIHGLAVFFAEPASALRRRIEADEFERLKRQRDGLLR